MKDTNDNFKPIAPQDGRDWLASGFGIQRCMCPRCAPPKVALIALSTDEPPLVTSEIGAVEEVFTNSVSAKTTEPDFKGAPV